MTKSTFAIMEIAHALSQLRSITFMAQHEHPETISWLQPEIEHAKEHLNNAIEAIDAARSAEAKEPEGR